MHIAKTVPKNQHHTGVARPPEANGTAYVAGTRNVKIRCSMIQESGNHLSLELPSRR